MQTHFESNLGEHFMSVNECSFYLSIHELTVLKLCHQGKIPAYKLFGRWRISKDRLDKWMEEQTEEMVK